MLLKGVGWPSRVTTQTAKLTADRKDAGKESHVRSRVSLQEFCEMIKNSFKANEKEHADLKK